MCIRDRDIEGWIIMNIDEKYELLKSKLRDMGKVVIAYSGGVDSNFLLKVASDELGQNAIAVTIHAMMHSYREMDCLLYTSRCV